MSERHLKVWLDDRRDPPNPHWVCVRTPEETIALLETGEVEELSLDHDLGLWNKDGQELTGYGVLLWIEQQVVLHNFVAPRLAVHSANPAARARMERAIQIIETRRAER